MNSAKQQNDAELPVGQRCVVKFHREDGGVVNRIRLVFDDDYIDPTSCLLLYHGFGLCVKGFISQLSRSFGILSLKEVSFVE